MSSYRVQRDSDHIWHVWINRRQDERRERGESWEKDLYEFKSMLQFLNYGEKLIADAFTGNLPKTHQQCSHQPIEQLTENTLKCVFGVDVTKCDILGSLASVFHSETERLRPWNGEKSYDVPVEALSGLMAKTCAWHIFSEVCKGRFLDTSEGYLTDDSDRLFWSRVYESLAASDPDDEQLAATDV